MPSSISSSSRVLAMVVAMLAAYCLAVEAFRPTVLLFPDQQAHNRARAERYLMERPTDTILVGSSLSVRMPDDWLPEDWLNLSFGGKGATTGLALIAATVNLPKRILIEINTLGLPSDQAFLDQLQGPIPLKLRQNLRGLREEYRPINLILSFSAKFRTGGALIPRGNRPLSEACTTLTQENAGDNVQQQIVAERLALVLQAQAAHDLTAQLKAAALVVRSLESRGVVIEFIEWPVHPDVAAAPATAALRAAIREIFGDRRIITFDLQRFQTEDGLHLAPRSARRAACGLVAELDKPGR